MDASRAPERRPVTSETRAKKDRTRDYLLLERSAPSFRLKRRIVAELLQREAPAPVGRAWDAGCGSGALSPLLARHAREEILLTDFEPASVSAARERVEAEFPAGAGPRVTARVFDLQQVVPPFAPVDLILCWAVLEHLADDAAGVACLARALAPRGRLVLNVPLHPRLYNALDRLEDHHRRYTRAGLGRLLGEAGLAVRWSRTFGFPALLATKILWAPFASRERALAGSAAAPALGSLLAAVDHGFYRAGFPWGVEIALVAERAEAAGPPGAQSTALAPP